MKRARRISFTPTPQVHRAIDQLIATGLFGRSPSALVEEATRLFVRLNDDHLQQRARRRARR